MENLPQDFKDFLSLLNDHKVEYLLVGGYAVAVHGYPRYTGDIDFWIEISVANAEKIVAALREFGFDFPDLSVEMFLDPDRMTRLGREPVKIEILNAVSGITYADAKNGATEVEIDVYLNHQWANNNRCSSTFHRH